MRRAIPSSLTSSGPRSERSQAMREVCVIGVGMTPFGKFPQKSILELGREAAREAYERAGLGPEELDLAEVHDCFTPAEILHYEDLGLCPKGEGGPFIASGATQIGGKIPVNPSGGLISKGHPLGATGIAQIAELVWQLRGQAGGRQVAGARVGLAHCAGGFQESLELAEVASVTVTILKA
ncbi:MAG: hypothetical protein HYY20_05315 [Candidatus Tectomicrobia bacterium]|uniref:propanoyl-CoA C-acyltransferase n=1 Tax=Tectimicrobiota bacterium TaxID=2528274 RepID=A0A932FWG0_UNCTE|nr:hypothetical protein [Candidatus Tectomicrobia bacterium]